MLSLQRSLLLLQGIYYVITGLWPLLHLDSFEAITGKKADRLTLHSTAVLVTVLGSFLTLSAQAKRPDPRAAILGATSALALAAVEIVHARRVRPVYAVDAVAEIIIAGGLLGAQWLSNLGFRRWK